MAKKFSLAHLTALECSPPELTYIAARAGYDYVSLRPIYMGLPGEPNYALAEKKEMKKQTKKALNDTGLELLDIELARIDNGINPKDYEPAFEVAAELGGRHVLSSIWTDDRSFAIESFHELCDLANPYGLTIELEFVPIAAVYDLAGALDVLKATNQQNAGLMIDAHHFSRSRDRAEDLDQVPKEWFRYFHLCDAPGKIPDSKEEMTHTLREERLYVGEGGIDLANMLNRIPEIPYSLEIPHTKRAQELGYEEFARRCLQSAKDYLTNHVYSTS
ncbi:sugar phosphate isomerase/epimerase [Geomicrobium halophilum]|uniref:Sugar phosphate isomerase/epimerase n=1 Tax=Geomicrobium halophilum TaxID=549000 RepID=A0A841PZY8_9BACL|nr:sugar phosphate isomerase/epimerase [Geomicrobium halophilum]MBB6450512.1 sugar phosphate isomerase/epimerase [Geomicrobium halophilum]